MAESRIYNISRINLAVSPLLHKEGDLLRSVNLETFPIGAKRKRPGYITYLGTANGSQVDGLFNWTRNNGTQFWNYRFSGGLLYSSQQGTGAWTITGNGTFNSAGTITNAVLEDTLCVSDGVGSVFTSTTGTSFTAASASPVAVSLEEYHQRIYAAGTASNLFWSNVGTPTDWTNDSSSVLIPGAGKLSALFKSGDRLVNAKNSGKLYNWDEFNLVDAATNLGPTSSLGIGNIEDYRIYPNRRGFIGYGGGKPELLSNAIGRQVYNDAGSGIIGTTFDSLPATTHQYRYYASIGTITDDLTNETINNAIAVYDFQQNDWWNYRFANRPTAWLSYKDTSGNEQLIFGGGSQCYQVAGTATSDNGTPIETVMEGVIHAATPDLDKEWREINASFNPGAQAKIQVAFADTFTRAFKTWVDIGDTRDGVVNYHFPQGSRSKLLFWKVYDNSATARYNFYGLTLDYDLVQRR